MNDSRATPAEGSNVRVSEALYQLARHPAETFVYSWNWKAALLSAMLRAPIFFVATMRKGFAAISVAVVVEAVYTAGISGCYGACVEKLRNARPVWASCFLIVFLLPATLLWFDYGLHWFTGMPNLKQGMISAAVLSFLSALFNWYLMLRGRLLVGSERRSFASDLKDMPRMVFDFVAWAPRFFYRLMRSSNLHLQA